MGNQSGPGNGRILASLVGSNQVTKNTDLRKPKTPILARKRVVDLFFRVRFSTAIASARSRHGRESQSLEEENGLLREENAYQSPASRRVRGLPLRSFGMYDEGKNPVNDLPHKQERNAR